MICSCSAASFSRYLLTLLARCSSLQLAFDIISASRRAFSSSSSFSFFTSGDFALRFCFVGEGDRRRCCFCSFRGGVFSSELSCRGRRRCCSRLGERRRCCSRLGEWRRRSGDGDRPPSFRLSERWRRRLSLLRERRRTAGDRDRLRRGLSREADRLLRPISRSLRSL